MNIILIRSAKSGSKPETVIEGNCIGIRMREPSETVHLRDDEDDPICVICGKPAKVWLSSKDRHGSHISRCS